MPSNCLFFIMIVFLEKTNCAIDTTKEIMHLSASMKGFSNTVRHVKKKVKFGVNATIGLKKYFCLSNNINGELRLKSPPLPTLCFCKIILTDGKKKEMPPIIVKFTELEFTLSKY